MTDNVLIGHDPVIEVLQLALALYLSPKVDDKRVQEHLANLSSLQLRSEEFLNLVRSYHQRQEAAQANRDKIMDFLDLFLLVSSPERLHAHREDLELLYQLNRNYVPDDLPSTYRYKSEYEILEERVKHLKELVGSEGQEGDQSLNDLIERLQEQLNTLKADSANFQKTEDEIFALLKDKIMAVSEKGN
jgi:hypothetical protein